ncbi:MAG TPA: YqgE/AlgH family protein [Tepidisphaeraceae bacterium]|nr:YqgE/AlgH family protein [Tepidisphaeraceae bacterium]
MKSLQGQLLIASPKLLDPNFFRAVVLIVQHNDEGALGLILNRPLETTIQMVWDQVSESYCASEAPLHQGGPCEGPLMVLHGDEALGQIPVLPGVYFSTDKETVEEIVSSREDNVRFFVGYSGWGGGQLEAEIESGAWLAAAAGEHVFAETQNLWDTLRRRIMLMTAYPWLKPEMIPDDPSSN